MKSFLLSVTTVEPTLIIAAVFAALSLVLVVAFLVERSKRKSSEARAAWLSQEMKRRPKLDPRDNKGAIHTVKEDSPAEIEYDARINPTPMGVIVKEEEDDEEDIIPPPPPSETKKGYEDRFTVNEEPPILKPRKIPSFKPQTKAEEVKPIVNDESFLADKILVREDEIEEGDVNILVKNKVRIPRNRKGLVQNFFVEESYDKLFEEETAPKSKTSLKNSPVSVVKEAEPEAAVDAQPKAEPLFADEAVKTDSDTPETEAPLFETEAPLFEAEAVKTDSDTLETEAPLFEAKAASETEPAVSAATIPEAEPVTESRVESQISLPQNTESPFKAASDALIGIASAFASIVDSGKKTDVEPEKVVPITVKPDARNSKPAPEKEDNSGDSLKELAKLGAKLADTPDMFEKAPYRRTITVNSSGGVPSSSQIKAPTAPKNPPFTHSAAPAPKSSTEKIGNAVREGEVELNIFMKPDLENELLGAKKAEAAIAPSAPTAESRGLREMLIVEEKPCESLPLQEKIAAEQAQNASAEEESYLINGEVVQVRYRSSFASRLIQAPLEVQRFYSSLKNEILAYDGIKVKNSWNYESFNRDGEQCVKLNVRGRSVLVYLALNPLDYAETKYRFKDMSETPKFEKVPMLLSVRTERGLKYATELIADVMRKFGATRGELPSVDYSVPYEENSALALRGLVKLILPDGVTVDRNSEIVPVNVDDFINSTK